MTPAHVRRLLHLAHVLAVLALVATGVLLMEPDLRARLVGGYGREVARIHNWVGWAFLAAPGLALIVAARPLLRDLRRRLGPPDPLWSWRKVHIVMSLVFSALLVVSGIVLWIDVRLPLVILDGALAIHEALTWALLAILPVHLVVARAKIVSRVRELAGRETPPDLPFDPDA